MFKASIQRHVRLGNVARQFSTASLMRAPRSENNIAAILHQTPSHPALRRLAPGYALSRLYSVESAAAQANRQDEFAPVASAPVSRFSELSRLGVNEGLVQALTKGMGYDAMTEVQSMTINSALKGVDMVAQAKTGTGKTLAFLVPLFQRVLADQPHLADPRNRRRSSSQDVRAIILSPTRELAEQIGVEARKLAQNTGIVVQTAVGGTRKRESLMQIRRQGCDVLVATPGRLNDLLTDPQSNIAAPNLQAFVLDEADRMLDVGFSDEIQSIQRSLPSPQEKERQTLLFSATIPRDVVHLAKSMVRPDNFEFVQTIKADDVPTHERVPQHLVTVQGYENIYPTILEIASKAKAQDSEHPFKAIIFFSNTSTVQFAYDVFRNVPGFARRGGTEMYQIHSKLTQSQRTMSAQLFRRAKSGILFSSDVTARGMDFPNVTDVIQIGLPPDREQYIHRIGRTGRAGNSGNGWLILSQEEMAEARNRLPGLPIKPNDTLKAAKQAVGSTDIDEDVSVLFNQVEKSYSNVPKSEFRDVYMGHLGAKYGKYFDAADMIGLLNNWCTRGLGWTDPPAISPRMAENRNLTRVPGVRIGHDDYDDEFRGDRRNQSFGSDSGFRRNDNFGNRNNSFGDRNSNFGDRNNNFRGRNDNFRGRSDNSRGRNDNFRGGRNQNQPRRNTFEDRFSSRVGEQPRSRYPPKASF
ncbi:DEAD-domain-containing protein [Xylaria arbuscula]|nr:DEAD-domain-containing protein [Xylaria arbuscula]